MPWEVRGGRTVKVSNDIEVVVEEGAVVDDALFVCGECGKEFKTEAGLERHVANKH